MSGLGKGLLSASLAKLLIASGYNVLPIKFDGYLNLDAGTINPFKHGEVFVLDDGTETDMVYMELDKDKLSWLENVVAKIKREFIRAEEKLNEVV